MNMIWLKALQKQEVIQELKIRKRKQNKGRKYIFKKIIHHKDANTPQPSGLHQGSR